MGSIYPPPDIFDAHTEQPQSSEHQNQRQHAKRPSMINNMEENHGTHTIGFVNFEPKHMKCPNCHHHITTELTYTVGDSSWAWCCCCILMGCFLGCCLLPFYADRFKDVVHNCPRCRHQIAYYKRNDPTDHRKI